MVEAADTAGLDDVAEGLRDGGGGGGGGLGFARGLGLSARGKQVERVDERVAGDRAERSCCGLRKGWLGREGGGLSVYE